MNLHMYLNGFCKVHGNYTCILEGCIKMFNLKYNKKYNMFESCVYVTTTSNNWSAGCASQMNSFMYVVR